MLKVKISAYISVVIGIVSILWVIYDYVVLANSAYKPEEFYSIVWRNVSLGFIPIVLFHISFFITVYFLFGYLKKQKEIIKEFNQLKNSTEQKREQ